MKRFLADALLICILVSVGSYISRQDDSGTQKELQEKIESFEEDVALKKTIRPKTEPVALNDIEDNGAGKFAKKSSEFVVNTIEGTVEAFSDIFAGIVK